MNIFRVKDSASENNEGDFLYRRLAVRTYSFSQYCHIIYEVNKMQRKQRDGLALLQEGQRPKNRQSELPSI